ncbi:MAG TPA: hypothetical protein VIF64_18120 [Pyrinomonadaceae bacterium]|jgi:FtsH-binding integral membrane protein
MESTTDQTANLSRPRTVATAVQLLAAALGLGLLRSILNLAQNTSGAQMFFALLIVIAFFGILFWVVRKISAGKNWARILVLIIMLVLILFLPFAIPAYLHEVRRSALLGTLSIIITLLQLIGTALLFTKQSNLWFKTRR